MSVLHDQNILRIAVASDLHAFGSVASHEQIPSHLKVLAAEDAASQDPVRHLEELIQRESLKADLVLSPGDLGNKASEDGIKYAWSCLHRIGQNLSAHLVTACAGNHDFDSRYFGNFFDPGEILQRLDPPFPLSADADNDRFWARKYVIRSTQKYRLVILNSAAYHGGRADEIHHGRITPLTLSRLAAELKSSAPAPVNIVLCHHHPHQFPEIGQADDTYGVMKNGQQLLDLLGSGSSGDWLVIHGHKHHARIAYAQGGNGSPTVMAAGSFSAVIYPELQSVARNQFYIIDLPIGSSLGMVGTIRAWDWSGAAGWRPAERSSGLAAVTKFGCRDTVQNLARKTNAFLTGKQSAEWGELVTAHPDIEFLLPEALDNLVNVLRSKYSIEVEYDRGVPKEFGKCAYD